MAVAEIKTAFNESAPMSIRMVSAIWVEKSDRRKSLRLSVFIRILRASKSMPEGYPWAQSNGIACMTIADG